MNLCGRGSSPTVKEGLTINSIYMGFRALLDSRATAPAP